ncbi:uncharacterized protein LOC141724622 isoform X2 [Apium graveolens]|uniref:uncharacterized protein LOC141724622 isoform X2 n=1 Tax=Apium graveolens TaxID=4045 RepID=UPI003D7924F2
MIRLYTASVKNVQFSSLGIKDFGGPSTSQILLCKNRVNLSSRRALQKSMFSTCSTCLGCEFWSAHISKLVFSDKNGGFITRALEQQEEQHLFICFCIASLLGSTIYGYNDLKSAIRNFSEEHKVREGGFGDIQDVAFSYGIYRNEHQVRSLKDRITRINVDLKLVEPHTMELQKAQGKAHELFVASQELAGR